MLTTDDRPHCNSDNENRLLSREASGRRWQCHNTAVAIRWGFRREREQLGDDRFRTLRRRLPELFRTVSVTRTQQASETWRIPPLNKRPRVQGLERAGIVTGQVPDVQDAVLILCLHPHSGRLEAQKKKEMGAWTRGGLSVSFFSFLIPSEGRSSGW